MAEAKLAKIGTNFTDFIYGIWRSLIFLVVILVMVFLSIKQRIKIWIFAVAAMTITLIDQLPLVAKYLPTSPGPKIYYAADDVVRFINKDKGVFRVFPTPWYEHTTDLYLLYHDIQSAGGYIPNPIQRYQEFIGAGTSVMFNPLNLIQYPKFLDMLNIKYIIAPNLPEDISKYDMQTQRTIQEIRNYISRFTPGLRGRRYSVYENENALPRAYIVSDYRVLEESEILDVLKTNEFDPWQFVVIEEIPGVPHPEEGVVLVEAKIAEYSPNKITCIAESSYPGFLVLTDNWHPGWKVFVDGEEKKLYQANYTFRAVYITAGKHEVVFAYISTYFNVGKIISIIVFVLSVGLCILAVRVKI